MSFLFLTKQNADQAGNLIKFLKHCLVFQRKFVLKRLIIFEQASTGANK